MASATFDKSRLLKLYARTGEAGVPKIFSFLNSDGTDHAIASYDFILEVFINAPNPFSVDPIFTLSVGSGLTVQNTNELVVSISATLAERKPDTYFWRLKSTYEDHTWLNGPLYFHNGEFDGVDDDETITVAENGDTVEITITGGGGGGSGTVTSVSGLSPLFTVANATTTPTFSLINQAANLVFAGPALGANAAPTFRALVAADIPALSYISALTNGNGTTANGTAVDLGGMLTADAFISGPFTFYATSTAANAFSGVAADNASNGGGFVAVQNNAANTKTFVELNNINAANTVQIQFILDVENAAGLGTGAFYIDPLAKGIQYAASGYVTTARSLTDRDYVIATVKTFSAAQTFENNTLYVGNPAGTFVYRFLGSPILASRDMTLPLLTGNDDFVFAAHSQALTNKTGNISMWTNDSGYVTSSGVTSVSGTTNRITSSGGATPTIDISSSYVGQSSITTLGTIATGVWNGTLIGPAYGGTGVANNASSTLTISGSFGTTLTVTATTSVTLPTSGTLATLAGTEALTNKTMVTQASVAGAAGLVLTPGVAPTGGALVNGAMWITSTGLLARINSVSYQAAIINGGFTSGRVVFGGGTAFVSDSANFTFGSIAANVLGITGKIRTTDDVTVNDGTKGFILKDTAGTPHYWRISVSTLGVLSTADLGTSIP